MDQRIIDFMEEQKLASICCIDTENKPYCFSCFFVFDRKKQLLYFKSSADTYHMKLLTEKPHISGTIQADKLNLLAMKGIQFTGVLLDIDAEVCAEAASVYHKKYPIALAKSGQVWAIQPEQIKMTDNSLGFGKKISWDRQEKSVV